MQLEAQFLPHLLHRVEVPDAVLLVPYLTKRALHSKKRYTNMHPHHQHTELLIFLSLVGGSLRGYCG